MRAPKLAVVAFVLNVILGYNNLMADALVIDEKRISIEENEVWWCGVIDDGSLMPFSITDDYEHDMLVSNKSNQLQPLLLSNRGRYIWCDEPIKIQFHKGEIKVSSRFAEIQVGRAGTSLKEAFHYACKTFFPPSGDVPPELFFTRPQYNTWIELTYNQNERDILKYAKGILESGFPAGILMIDDTWQMDYGQWEFNPEKFKDPLEMTRKLKEMGFKVMLWVCPFVSADSPVFRQLRSKDLFVKNNPDGKPAMIEWWNGVSAVLDFSNPETCTYFAGILDNLKIKYGIDGFKLDGGDTRFYSGHVVGHDVKHANDYTAAWARFGLRYPYNEYRVAWKQGGQALVQRLHDKSHSWEDLRKLIPNSLVQGLMGYAYVCPDMIGGGEFKSFINLDKVDQELIVRSAQCQALMPMMQFSVAPWRVLSESNMEICREMAKLHVRFGKRILQLAQESARTGEPIVRHMAYVFPDQNYEEIDDQFLLGDSVLVAPVLGKGARSRVVQFPPGKWQDEEGHVVTGPVSKTVEAPLEKLPWFKRVDKS